jgi:succinate-semialdehyde dehydrogenase / glutarate-semialdehyde dehydrogenase
MTTTPAADPGAADPGAADPGTGVQAAPAGDRFLGSRHVGAELLERLRRRVAAGAGAPSVTVTAPATGGRLAELPGSTPDDVRAAVAAARAAQPAWAARPLAERARVLRRYGELVLARQDEIMDLLQLETGKARGDAFEEVADTGVCASYYGHRAPRALGPTRRRGALPLLTRTTVNYHPVGVVGTNEAQVHTS